MFSLRPLANHEPLPLPELTNSATFPHPTTYYNPPSTRYADDRLPPAHGTEHGVRSANLGLHFPPVEEVPLQLPQMNEELPQL